MHKFMKIPWYIPFAGLMISFVLIILAAFFPNPALLITAIVLLHLFAWIFAARYFFLGIGFFSWALDPK